MEALGVRNRNSTWTGGSKNDKSSLLLDPRSNNSNGYSNGFSNSNGYSSMESPLATQLQQAWLHTQLPKRNIPKLDYLSPLPSPDYNGSSRSSPDYFQQQLQQQIQPQQPHIPTRTSSSSSFSQASPQAFSHPSPQQQYAFSPDSYSGTGTHTSQSDVGSVSPNGEDFAGETDPMEDDDMLQYLSDMLMDEDLSEKKCMYVQCSAYQAMNKELAQLIGDPVSSGDLYSADESGCTADTGATPAPVEYQDEKNTAMNSWIDEVLNSNPQDFLHEEPQQLEQLPMGDDHQAVNLANEVSSIASRISGITTDNSRLQQPILAAAAVPALPEKPAANLDLDCPYLENDVTVDGTDYTNGKSGVESLVELYPLLMQCAQAVAADDVRTAHQLINQLRQKSSPLGDGGQRMTYYFTEALVARLSGTGAQLYTALSSNRPSAHEMLKAYRLFVQCNPLPKISHYFANVTILNAVKDSDRIHIIDFGILYGVQWPCLLHKLAQRKGGPPHVRITGIDFAQPGFQKNDRVEETGRRLAEKARQLGVEFEYHAIAGKWETIQPAQLTLRNDETLIVNSMFRLRNLLDETVMASSPRKMVLAKIHSLNPKLFVMGVISAGYNSPFFMARFRETISHFSALFDAIHSSVPPDTDLRRLAEKEVLGREILNVIACEGTERIERAETYRQWQSRSLNAGFKQVLLDPDIVGKTQDILKRYHRNYGVGQDGNWLLTGWRDRVLHGLTAWTSS